MRILSISGILPIPPIIENNDFVFQTYSKFLELMPETEVTIIKPLRYQRWMYRKVKHSRGLLDSPSGKTRKIKGFSVDIFPYFSSWRFRNLHSIICHSIYYLNRKRIQTLINSGKFDLIHAQYIFPDGILAYQLKQRYHIPYVITTHNESVFFDRFLSRKIVLKVLMNASKVIPISFMNYSEFQKMGIKNLQLIPLGFSNAFVRNQKTQVNKRISIVTIAQLIKLKNIDKVIQSFANLASDYSLTYTIIGQGPEKEYLEKLVAELNLCNSVYFIDHVPHEEIADELYKHDIFIMPSYFETFGRVYFESMAMGIPIICAKNSGIYGIFKEMEEGISVKHDDINDITEALRFLITHPKERMEIGLKGKRLVENFTWENIVTDLNHHVYSEAINKKEITN